MVQSVYASLQLGLKHAVMRCVIHQAKDCARNIDEMHYDRLSTELNTPFATKADVGMEVSNTRIDELFETESRYTTCSRVGVLFCAQLLRHSPTTNVVTMYASLPDNMIVSPSKMMTITQRSSRLVRMQLPPYRLCR